jgi:hypothetical protein
VRRVPTSSAPAALVRRVEKQVGALTTRALGRLEDISWFAQLPADVRSWIGVVIQAGLQGFVQWLRDPEKGPAPDATFAAAPRTVARAVTLEQTVELIRFTIDVVEDAVDELMPADRTDWLRRQVERYSREVAFSAAVVYARAAEQRGALDARLQALVVEALLGGEPDRVVAARAGALGATTLGPVFGLALRPAPGDHPETALDELQRAARRTDATVVAAVHGDVVVSAVAADGQDDPVAVATPLVSRVGAAVVGPIVESLPAAGGSTRAALGGLAARDAWPAAPQPVHADALLPERVLAGEAEARDRLLEVCYRSLANTGETLVSTVETLLACGGSLEATARDLFVHPNTLRYRLSRVLELTGYDPRHPRDGFALRIALALARL